MAIAIQTDKLTKYYGPHRGIVDVDLEVAEGEAFGFLGPNGAGKTTMIRLLLDHLRPTGGRATIFGAETTADPVAIHRRIGYLPGEFVLYDRLTGGQTLDFFANLRGGVDRTYQRALVERLAPFTLGKLLSIPLPLLGIGSQQVEAPLLQQHLPRGYDLLVAGHQV